MRVRAAAGFGLVLLLAATAVAAPAKGPAKGSAKKSAPGGGFPPESLGAQGFLEDLLARRYAQDLATLVERSEFTVGAQLELTELAPPKPKPPAEPAAANETPPDLLLGTLDPEALLAKYAGPEAVVWATTFLQHYRIRTVTLSVGLRET